MCKKEDISKLCKSGNYVIIPRALAQDIIDNANCQCIEQIYFWLHVHAAYGPMVTHNGVRLERGEIELKPELLMHRFNITKRYLYYIIKTLIDKGLLKKKKNGVYRLVLYDQYFGNHNKELTFVDKEELKGSFREFWKVYHHFVSVKRIEKYRCQCVWVQLSDEEKEEALQFIPEYAIYSKNHAFKKTAYAYLRDKTYKNEP